MSAGSITFADYAQRFIEDYASVRMKPTGYVEYSGIIAGHLVPWFGDRKLGDIAPAEIQAYIARKVESGLAPRTTLNHRAVLKKMFAVAIDWRLVGSNPAVSVASPRIERVERQFLTVEQMRRLIEATDPAWRSITALPCLVGARRGEVLAASWEAASFSARTIRLSRSMRRGVVYESKTPASRATVAMPRLMTGILHERYLRMGSPERGLCFTRADGSPLSDSRPNAVLRAALARAGLPPVRYHDLRRSWCMALIEARVPVKTIVAMGRWQSAQTFIDEYGVFLPSMGGDAADVLDDLMQGG